MVAARRADMTFPRFPFTGALTLALAWLSIGAGVSAQQGDGTDVAISAHVFKPAQVAPTPRRISQLRTPPGFKVRPFATGLKNSRVLAVAADGSVYVSRREQGDVLLLRDTNGDGRADGAPKIVANRPGAHGIAVHDGKLYLITVKEIFVSEINADGTLAGLQSIVGDLPDAGQHPNRTIAFGPDGMLYISVGSTCNACNESNPENATLLRASADGKQRTIYASGLRNMIGFDWNPTTGELWGLDNGIDFLGDELQPEELNKIEQGKQYGWPHVWGIDGINPQSTPVGDITKEQWKALSQPMVLGYAAHAAPMQMVFYRGGYGSHSFPAGYVGDAFATMRGSWNRKPASGYEIVRIHFEGGQPQSIEPFVTGFLSERGRTHIARPMGLAIWNDGSLLMADDANGSIYRISYEGADAGAPSAPYDAEVPPQPPPDVLASARPETQSSGQIVVTSPSFAANRSLGLQYSEYGDGFSPALTWNAVPSAVSYVLIVEDPDAKPITPFVHWLAWNIPASVTQLPEGVQEQPRLTLPEGVLQGRNSRGSTGYYGPHPPVGDPAHHYHFQVFALDTMLSAPPGADRAALLEAVKGHVIARGEIVGLYAQTVASLK
jgi:Raf kinase inhibitor-like YbhB/YbcL family protein